MAALKCLCCNVICTIVSLYTQWQWQYGKWMAWHGFFHRVNSKIVVFQTRRECLNRIYSYRQSWRALRTGMQQNGIFRTNSNCIHGVLQAANQSFHLCFAQHCSVHLQILYYAFGTIFPHQRWYNNTFNAKCLIIVIIIKCLFFSLLLCCFISEATMGVPCVRVNGYKAHIKHSIGQREFLNENIFGPYPMAHWTNVYRTCGNI